MATICPRIWAVFLFLALAFTANAQTEIKVTVDGEIVAFPDQKPIMMANRVLVPLRGVFEMMYASVDWDPGQKLVTAKTDTRRVELLIYKTTARIDNVPYDMDVPAQLIGGRAMVPLRFLGQALGAQVNWNAAINTVEITTSEEAKI